MENFTINLNNLSADERKQLISSIISSVERSYKPKGELWKPSINESYWFIASDGTIIQARYTDKVPYDSMRIDLGNYFKTEQEALEALTSLKMKTKWRELSIKAGENENLWTKANSRHWMPYFDYAVNQILFTSSSNERYTGIYFPSKESLIEAINELGEENVKKYILNVTND